MLGQHPQQVIGWDIGGAHVKAVYVDADGVVQHAIQLPCALWQGLHLLEEAVLTVMASLAAPAKSTMHAVTMTGELVDLFESRQQGVQAIADCVQKLLPHASFYAADAKGVRWLTTVQGQTAAVASMNWHASALSIARRAQDVLVIDIGSTTTDVTACVHGQVLPAGWSDATRMAQGSLLYSGVVRTPLMAFGPQIDWQGRSHWLAAEYFATMADVYRLLGQLPAAHDMAATADGQDKSLASTMRRLARMVGHDAEDLPATAWQALAIAFAKQQQEYMVQVCQQSLKKNQAIKQLVALGAGAFLAPALAQRLGLAYQPATTHIAAATPALQTMAVVCFPAYAVASLRLAWA